MRTPLSSVFSSIALATFLTAGAGAAFGQWPDYPTGVPKGADGKPDLNGFYEPNAGGANYGLEKRAPSDLTPPGRGVIV